MTRQLRVSDDIADWLSSLDAGSLSSSAMRVLVWAREAIEAAEEDSERAMTPTGSDENALRPRAGKNRESVRGVRTSANASRRLSFSPIVRRP